MKRLRQTIKQFEVFKIKRKIASIDWTNTILVYQPGKVASSTINHALSIRHPGPIIHMHTLNDDQNISDVKREFSRLHQLNKLPKIKIITLVREPIGRNLSAFYQNLNKLNQIKFDGVPFLTEELWELYMKSGKASFILNWFDQELSKNFGIDAYSKPFPECGFTTFENEKAEVLLMKHSLDDVEKSQLIGEFTGLNNFTLGHQKNTSAQKWYGRDYEHAKKSGFPRWYVHKMLDSKYTKHFYLNDIPELSKRWTSREKT